MDNKDFKIEYDTQNKLKTAIEVAISYCEQHIPHADSWSAQNLESNLKDFKALKEEIGNSWVVGHFE